MHKRIKLAEEAEEHDIENQLNEVAVVFPEQQAYKDDEEGEPEWYQFLLDDFNGFPLWYYVAAGAALVLLIILLFCCGGGDKKNTSSTSTNKASESVASTSPPVQPDGGMEPQNNLVGEDSAGEGCMDTLDGYTGGNTMAIAGAGAAVAAGVGGYVYRKELGALAGKVKDKFYKVAHKVTNEECRAANKGILDPSGKNQCVPAELTSHPKEWAADNVHNGLGGFAKTVDKGTTWATKKAGYPDAIPKLSSENNWVKGGVLAATAVAAVAVLWYPVKWVVGLVKGESDEEKKKNAKKKGVTISIDSKKETKALAYKKLTKGWKDADTKTRMKLIKELAMEKIWYILGCVGLVAGLIAGFLFKDKIMALVNPSSAPLGAP